MDKATLTDKIYTPLDPTREEFRLLLLHAISNDSSLSVSLSKASLQARPRYEALSYVWGREYSQSPLLVNGYEFRITKNLEIALQHLRSNTEDRTLWIDAICINQSPDAEQERNAQIQLMRRIYETAQTVVIWLGPATPNTSSIPDFVRELSCRDQSGIIESLRDPLHKQKWRAVFDLCRHEYWTRVWTMQEIACSTSAVMQFGHDLVNWRHFGLIGRAVSDIYSTATILEGIDSSDLSAVRTVIARRSLQILIEEGNPPSLIRLLNHVRRYKCAKARDRVLAVTGMSKERDDFTVPYSSPLPELFLATARFIIEKTRNLDIICDKEIPPNPFGKPFWEPSKLNLPSWCPDWTILPGCNPFRSRDSWYQYKAAGLSEAIVDFSDDGRVITCAGSRIGQIIEVGEVYFDVNESGIEMVEIMAGTLRRWLQIALKDVSENEAKEHRKVFWKVMIGNRASAKKGPPSLQEEEDFSLVFDVLMGLADSSLSRDDVFRDDHSKPVFSQYSWPFVWEAKDLMFNRRLLIISEDANGYGNGRIIGLGPPTAQVGDDVMVLAGCSHPVVLRQVGDFGEFIGEAYVDGYMEGKAVGMVLEGKLKSCTYSLK